MTPQERREWVRQMGARPQWWESRREAVVEPDCEIVDAHIHLWDARAFPDPTGGSEPLRTSRYLLDELLCDTGGGHNVTGCVYIECGSGYHADGPVALRPVGETEFAAGLARKLASSSATVAIGAIVAHVDMRDPEIDSLLDAHEQAGGEQFRGARHSAARVEDPSARLLAGAAPAGLNADPDFRRGVKRLGERGLPFDSFQFHFQLGELAELARAAPQTTIIINHLGAPVGYDGAPAIGDPVFSEWSRHVEMLAGLPNTVMKLGGIASIVTGYDGHLRDKPPSSEEFVAERGAYYRHAIDCFGPQRCMFESNFPVDSASIGYLTLWNAHKIIAMEYDAPSRQALLAGTARRVYRMQEINAVRPALAAVHPATGE